MTDLAPRPRSATELVDAAFQVYRRHPAQFILVTALVYVPWLVVRLVLGIGVRTAVPDFGTLAVVAVGTFLSYSLVSGVVTRIAHDVYLGQPVDTADAVRQVIPRFAALAMTALIKLAFLFAGLLMFLVGILYPLARYFAVFQAVVLEGRGVVEAFGRSTKLSEELKLHILGTLILFFVINVTVSIGIGLAITVLSNRVLEQVLTTVTSIIVYPLYGIGETLLYYDARIRKEGFDIELLASMAPLPPDSSAGAAI